MFGLGDERSESTTVSWGPCKQKAWLKLVRLYESRGIRLDCGGK